jgi:hypothetical protein
MGFFVDFMDEIGSGIAAGFAPIVNPIINKTEEGLTKAVNGIAELGEKAVNGIAGLGEKAVNGIAGLGEKVVNGAVNLGEKTVNGAANFGEKAFTLAGSTLEGIAGKFTWPLIIVAGAVGVYLVIEMTKK